MLIITLKPSNVSSVASKNDIVQIADTAIPIRPCYRSILPQAKYRCVNLVMRMLGSTNLSCRWATVGLLGYLFLRIFFISRINKNIKDTHLNELSLSLFPCSKNIAESLVKVLPCNMKCQKWPQLFYDHWGSSHGY